MSETNWNIKPRLVKCASCGLEEITDRANPKCLSCNGYMITFVKTETKETK